MLDLLAFKATDVPIRNEMFNGNFSNPDREGLAEFTTKGSAVYDTRTENGRQYFRASDVGSLGTINQRIINERPVGKVYVRFDYNRLWAVYRLNTTNVVKYKGMDSEGSVSLVIDDTSDYVGLSFRAMNGTDEELEDSYVGNVISINLTQTFGEGNEPTAEQMDKLLESRFENGWFDGTKNLFNGKRVVNDILSQDKRIKELEETIKNLVEGV